MATKTEIIPTERILGRIRVLRGVRVLLDADLAAIYEVPTKRLLEQMKRNAGKFPEDFVFQLTREEFAQLHATSGAAVDDKGLVSNWSQNATSSLKHRGAGKLPYAFTEHGALQAANVLSSPSAAQMSIAVIRAFVALRQMVVNHKALAAKLAELDARVGAHDEQLRSASPASRRAPRRRAPSLRYGAARRARDHLRAPRSVASIIEAIRELSSDAPAVPAHGRKIGYHKGNR